MSMHSCAFVLDGSAGSPRLAVWIGHGDAGIVERKPLIAGCEKIRLVAPAFGGGTSPKIVRLLSNVNTMSSGDQKPLLFDFQ
jgi:hypothetical protein